MKKVFFNEWSVIEKIGEGSLSTVYKCEDISGAICAVKHIKLPAPLSVAESLVSSGVIESIDAADNFFIDSIDKEIEIMDKLDDDPCIVQFFESYRDEQIEDNSIDYYLRMEYTEDLRNYFSNKEISGDDIVNVGIDICTALELCEKNDLVHNDIKPSNIFVGKNGRFKLGDFGISSEVGSCNNVFFGTFNYLSPEIYHKQSVNHSTDLYSLGLVLYKLLSGELPFVTADVNELSAFNKRMAGEEIPYIADLNEDFMAIISKACAYKAEDRYQSATEMKNDLLKLPSIDIGKKTVNFNSSSFETTASIYDSSLLAMQSNIPKKTAKKRLRRLFKFIFSRRFFGFLMFVAFVAFMVSLVYTSYSLNITCEDGYVNKLGKCVKGYYYCEKGYTLNKKNQCQKTVESVDADLNYTCDDGWILKDDLCINSETADPKFVYKCADGFTLHDKKCSKEESMDAVPTYACPEGAVPDQENGTCVSAETVDPITSQPGCLSTDHIYRVDTGKCFAPDLWYFRNADVNYYCNEGGTLSGTTCTYVEDSYISYPDYTPACKKGTYNSSDGKCHYTEGANIEYYCSGLSSEYERLDGSNCKYPSGSGVSYNSFTSSTCPEGYISVGNACARPINVDPVVTYNCIEGSELRGKRCYASITSDAVGIYECPKGYVASGLSCYIDEFPKAEKKYTCSRIYTLNGDKCEKYDITLAKVKYLD